MEKSNLIKILPAHNINGGGEYFRTVIRFSVCTKHMHDQ